MRDWMLAIVDGLVQGITEFLPVSSSAHLYLAQAWWDAADDPLSRIVVVHLGTLLGASWALRRQIAGWLSEALWPADARAGAGTYVGKLPHILVASVPVLLVGVLLHTAVEGWYTLAVIATTTLVFGVLLGLALRWGAARRDWNSLSIADACVAGCAQVLALIPGTSRSGICLTALLALGFHQAVAARFTVLMAIPVLGAIVFWMGWRWWSDPSLLRPAADLCAGATAGISAWWIVRYGLIYLERSRRAPLLWICIAWRILLGCVLVSGLWFGWFA